MSSEKQGNPYVSWSLRVLLILMILIFAMFSIDVFEEGRSLWDITVGLFMHNIPSFIMIIFLIIAWKWEHIGGALIMLGFIGFSIFLFESGKFMWGTLILVSIPFLIGALFVLNHYYLGKKGSE